MFFPFLPEAADAVGQAGGFLADLLGAASSAAARTASAPRVDQHRPEAAA